MSWEIILTSEIRNIMEDSYGIKPTKALNMCFH